MELADSRFGEAQPPAYLVEGAGFPISQPEDGSVPFTQFADGLGEQVESGPALHGCRRVVAVIAVNRIPALAAVLGLSACGGSDQVRKPAAAAATAPVDTQRLFPPQASPPVQFYVVQPGDSIYGIAFKYGVSIDDLMAANNISDARLLSPGQQLVIPRPRQ